MAIHYTEQITIYSFWCKDSKSNVFYLQIDVVWGSKCTLLEKIIYVTCLIFQRRAYERLCVNWVCVWVFVWNNICIWVCITCNLYTYTCFMYVILLCVMMSCLSSNQQMWWLLNLAARLNWDQLSSEPRVEIYTLFANIFS